jgi:hypothetical protein
VLPRLLLYAARAGPVYWLTANDQGATEAWLVRHKPMVRKRTGDLPDMSNRFRAVNKLQKIRRNGFDKLKPPWLTMSKTKKPATITGAGF